MGTLGLHTYELAYIFFPLSSVMNENLYIKDWVAMFSPVSYNVAVEKLKMPLVFKPKLYEYP